MRGLALQLLEANEVPIDGKHLLPLSGLDAAEELQQGRVDAAFIIAAPEAPVVPGAVALARRPHHELLAGRCLYATLPS